ncbi:MAG: N-6 DNA methylase, partial [Paludibacter sp.]|nr:N-6 DNA methylase [Paludibacter sp.]
DKKIELGITRGHAPLSAAGRHAPLSDPTKQTMYKKLTTYREWLLQITICDPACGSGAFLNQVLNFLIDEHRYIDELQAKLFGDALVLSDIENTILENNLFGVDINEESVEIAKLSLWLRTAQPNRKLNDLSRNIKCGNSLIDDPAIAGDKAFVWEQEFPQIFHKKQKKAWHITTATHNSRYSERMFDNYVKLGEPVWLWAEEELIVSQTIADITEKDKLNILAYNACGDHLHLLLVCEEKEVETIVGKLKYMSARSCNIAMGRTTTSSGHVTRGHAPLSTEKSLPERGDTQAKLWTQKFGCTEIIGEEQRYNAIAYIKNNRVKHELPESKELLQIIEKMVKTVEDAYSTEYKGGFDVVIGNPPYGAKLDNNTQKYLNEKFIKGGSETAISFVKLAYDYLLKPKGNFGFIIPKAFSFSSNYESIREFILNDINEIVDCKKVWKEVLLEQIILIFQKNKATSLYNCGRLKGQSIEIVGTIDKQYFKTFGFYLNDITNSELNIGLKIRSSNKYIGDIANNSRGGIFQNKVSETGDIDVLGGAEIQRMGITGIKGKISLNIIKGDSKCFINDNSILVQNIVAHIENPTDHIKITACLPFRKDYAIVDTINQLTFKSEFNNKVFWLILNSNLINWFSYRFIFARAIRTMHFDNSITNRIPIPSTISLSDQQPFIAKADLMLALNNQLQEVSGKFQRSIQRKFNLEDLPGKLQNWYQLTYGEFIKELGKKKIKLSLAEEAEWESYFVQETEKALAIKKQIETTDCEIDRMVYELYGLTEEEINIIEKTN